VWRSDGVFRLIEVYSHRVAIARAQPCCLTVQPREDCLTKYIEQVVMVVRPKDRATDLRSCFRTKSSFKSLGLTRKQHPERCQTGTVVTVGFAELKPGVKSEFLTKCANNRFEVEIAVGDAMTPLDFR